MRRASCAENFLIAGMIFVLAAIANGFPTVVWAQSASQSGPLDGMVFVGKIGPPDAPDRDDELHFSNGKFWSAICIRCGFRPGDYWVRKVGNSVHFRGELLGERGTFTYFGQITAGKADVSINWTKKRWYWSIDKDIVFKGELAPAGLSNTASEAVKVAIQATANLPANCQ